MKLFKGFLAIVLIAMVVVSCEPKKKEKVDATKTEKVVKDGADAVKDAAKKVEGTVKDGAKKVEEAVKEGAEKVKEGAKKVEKATKSEVDKLKKETHTH